VSESTDCWECSGSWVKKVFPNKQSAEEWIGEDDYRKDFKIEEFIIGKEG